MSTSGDKGLAASRWATKAPATPAAQDERQGADEDKWPKGEWLAPKGQRGEDAVPRPSRSRMPVFDPLPLLPPMLGSWADMTEDEEEEKRRAEVEAARVVEEGIVSAQPQTAQPQTAQPQTAQPQTTQPQTAQPQTAQPATGTCVLADRTRPVKCQDEPPVTLAETREAEEKEEKPAAKDKGKDEGKDKDKDKDKGKAPRRSPPGPEAMQRLWRKIRPPPIRPMPGYRPFQWPVHEDLADHDMKVGVMLANKYFIKFTEYVELRLVRRPGSVKPDGERVDGERLVLLVYFGDDVDENNEVLDDLVVAEVRTLATVLSNWVADCRVHSSLGKPPVDLFDALYDWKALGSNLLQEPVPGEILLHMLDENEPIHRVAPVDAHPRVAEWARPVYEGPGSPVEKAKRLALAARERPIQRLGVDIAGLALRVALQMWRKWRLEEQADDREEKFVKHLLMLEDRGADPAALDLDKVLDVADMEDTPKWRHVEENVSFEGVFGPRGV